MKSNGSFITLLILTLFGAGFWASAERRDDALTETSIEFEQELESCDIDLEVDSDAVVTLAAANRFSLRAASLCVVADSTHCLESIREHATRGPPQRCIC